MQPTRTHPVSSLDAERAALLSDRERAYYLNEIAKTTQWEQAQHSLSSMVAQPQRRTDVSSISTSSISPQNEGTRQHTFQYPRLRPWQYHLMVSSVSLVSLLPFFLIASVEFSSPTYIWVGLSATAAVMCAVCHYNWYMLAERTVIFDHGTQRISMERKRYCTEPTQQFMGSYQAFRGCEVICWIEMREGENGRRRAEVCTAIKFRFEEHDFNGESDESDIFYNLPHSRWSKFADEVNGWWDTNMAVS